MTLYIKKKKVMTFNKNGRHIRGNFVYREKSIETARQYKYIGFLVTLSGEMNSGLKDLKERAIRVFLKLKKKMGITFKRHPTTSIKLFRSLLEPILLCGSDFWGTSEMPANNPIENLFMSFCKQLLAL